MRFAPLAVLGFSLLPFAAESAPFQPQDGILQRNRRRAVDYPVQSSEPQSGKLMRKRSVNYSVVQVDGGPSSSPSPSTIIQTVTGTASALPASTATIIYTSVVQGTQSQETVVVTTTQELSETVTTELPAASITIISTPNSGSTVTTQSNAAAGEDTNSIVATVTTTMSPTAVPATTVSLSSSTSYYDDGQWHTYYPVKDYVPPSLAYSTPSMHQARAVPAAVQTQTPGAALPSEWAWKQHMKKRSAAGFAYGPHTASFGASYATPAVRAGVVGPPHAYIKRASDDAEPQLPHPAFKLPSLTAVPVVETEYLLKRTGDGPQVNGNVHAKRVAGAAYPSGSYGYGKRTIIPGAAQPTAWAGNSQFPPRKAPTDLKLASWNITGVSYDRR